MQCPYCLEDFVLEKIQKEATCLNENCQRELSRLFLNGISRRNPYFSCGMVGFSNHGKTVYITTLFYMLKDIITNTWPGFTMMALDQESIRMVFERIDQLKKGLLPEATRVNFTDPCLVTKTNIAQHDTIFVAYHDIGGEVYEEMKDVEKTGKPIAKSHTLMFMISISESQYQQQYYSENNRHQGDNSGKLQIKSWQDDITRLINTYFLAAHDRLGLNPREYQNLIVVFTKADEFFDQLPPELQSYLLDGDINKYKSLNKSLLDRIRNESKMIEQWLCNQQATGFVNLCRRNFKSVNFCMVSALGQSPDGNRLQGNLRPEDPKNVLDPFILALGNHIDFREKKNFWSWIRRIV